MKYRAVGGFRSTPEGAVLGDAHLGVSYDYRVAGKRLGEVVDLLLSTIVIDHLGKRYIRKSKHLVRRELVVDCVESMIRDHLLAMGTDPVQVQGLLRDFEFDKKKVVKFDWNEFAR